MSGEPSTRRARWRGLSLLAFPLVLWAFASLYFGGDLGKWNDDYFFLGQFQPETMEVRSWTLTRPLHFWRPLYRVVATPLNTLLFEHDRINHVITACVHGAACLGLFALLRRLGACTLSAAIAATAFMVYPAHFECVFWNTVMFTPLATGTMLGAIALAWRWHRRGGWWAAAGAGVLTFVATAMNEQPGAMAAGIGALALLAPRRPGEARVRRFVPTAAAACALALYLVGQEAFTKFTPRPVELGQLPHRVSELIDGVRSQLLLRRFGEGALRVGWRALLQDPAIAAAWGLGLAATLAAWLGAARRCEGTGRGDPGPNEASLGPAALVLLGAAVFAGAWVPIARVEYDVSPRLHYAPNIGLAMILAGVLTGLQQLAARRLSTRTRGAASAVAAACFAAASILSAVMLVGVQSAYAERFGADEEQGAQLRKLVPDPGEGAVFVPVHIEDRPIRAGRGGSALEAHFLSPWRSPWAAGWYVQRLYRRSDVFACIGAWPSEAEIRPDAGDGKEGLRQFHFTRTFAQPHPRTERSRESRVRWHDAVLFAVNERGRVVVVTQVRIIRPDGTSVTIRPRRTRDACADERGARRTLELIEVAGGKWQYGLEKE